jgi:hypothetical protein
LLVATSSCSNMMLAWNSEFRIQKADTEVHARPSSECLHSAF